MSEPRVHLRHVRELGLCSHGITRFWRNKDRTLREFLEQGVPCSWFRAQDDARAVALADYAERNP